MRHDRLHRRMSLRPHALGSAFLPLVLTLTLTACQPATPVCNTAGALSPSPPLTVVDGAVYAETLGALSALRAGTGALVWRSAQGSLDVPTSPLVTDGYVITESGPGMLVALHISDGSLAWRSRRVPHPETANSLLPPSLTLSGAIVYASASRDSVAAWHVADGTLLWQSPPLTVPTDPIYASGFAGMPEPVVAGDIVYFSAGQSVHAVRAADGSLLWSSPALQPENLYVPPVLADSRLFVVARDSSLYALDASTGTILWHALDPYTPGPAEQSSQVIPSFPIVRDGIVYYASFGGVRALAADTGALLWHFGPYNSGFGPPPQIAGGVAYVVSGITLSPFGTQIGEPGAISALDAHTGAVRWRVTLPYVTGAPFFVNNDAVYTITPTVLAAWHTSDGALLWQHTVGSLNYLHVIFADGAIYLSTNSLNSCGTAEPSLVSAFRAADGAPLWQTSVPVL